MQILKIREFLGIINDMRKENLGKYDFEIKHTKIFDKIIVVKPISNCRKYVLM